MKQYTFIRTLALMVILAFTACGSDELPDDPSFDQEIKTELVDKSQLPEWLVDYIDYLEYVPDGQDLPKEPSGIYRFEWDGATYYEISSPSQSTIHEKLYTGEGVPVRLDNEQNKSISDVARNWTIVYMIKPHHGIRHAVYPIEPTNTLKTFFQKAFDSPSYEYNGFKFQYENTRSDCYIINSQEQLQTIYLGEGALPDIDFDNYTLILGKVVNTSGSQLKRQELIMENGLPVMKVFIERPEFPGKISFGFDMINYCFWGLYPKVSNEDITLYKFSNNKLSPEATFSWTKPQVTDFSPLDVSSWDIQRDEAGRIERFTCFDPQKDPMDKLYRCPSSFEDIKFLFPLSEGNEIRFDEPYPLYVDAKFPSLMISKVFGQQYYKDIRVEGGQGCFSYYLTRDGLRMSSAFFEPFYDIKDLDVNPHITYEKAAEVFTNYTNLPLARPIEEMLRDTLGTQPHIGEFVTLENGKAARSVHLYYTIYGPLGHCNEPLIPGTAISESRCIAMIDAHTGEILKTNYKGE